MGGRSDPQQGKACLLWRGCCVGQGCSQLHITLRTSLEETFQEESQGRGYLKGKVSVLSVFSYWCSGWAVVDWNLFLLSGEGTEIPDLVRTCLRCPLDPARTEMPLDIALLLGGVCRAELSTHLVGVRSVNMDREEMRGQRNSSGQGHLQAAETWAGRERDLLPETPWEGRFGHVFAIPCSADAFPRATSWSLSLAFWGLCGATDQLLF